MPKAPLQTLLSFDGLSETSTTSLARRNAPTFRYHHSHQYPSYVLHRNLTQARNSHPHHHKHHKPSKRTLTVSKPEGEPFGAQLWYANSKVYVVFVSEFVNSQPTQAGGKQKQTAAFRAGLVFGDEITAIDDEEVKDISLVVLVERLQKAEEVTIDIIEAPLERHHMIHPDDDEPLGIIYSLSKVTKVSENSIAQKGGLKVGHTMFSVKGRSMVGKSDAEVSAEIKRAMDKGKPFDVVTIPHKAYAKLFPGMQVALAALPSTSHIRGVHPSVFIDYDFDVVQIRKWLHVSRGNTNMKMKRPTGRSRAHMGVEVSRVVVSDPRTSARLSTRIRDFARTSISQLRARAGSTSSGDSNQRVRQNSMSVFQTGSDSTAVERDVEGLQDRGDWNEVVVQRQDARATVY